jgi:hypothetical protein
MITGSCCDGADVRNPHHHEALWRAVPSADIDTDTEIARQKRGAAQVFWMWLIVATSMSVGGNVAQAVLHADSATVALAAGAALVPPLVLLAATHSTAVLVRTHAGGLTYWCALLMTLALASCAFVLSFDALRSLAVTLGLPVSIAWLWPCAIDVAIAQATLCLLSLSRCAATHSGAEAAAVSAEVANGEDQPRTAATRAAATGHDDSRARTAESAVIDALDTAAIERCEPVAQSLVRDGVTSKHPQLVATILAHREAGVPPSTIGRTYKVHHTTVGGILSAADAISA